MLYHELLTCSLILIAVSGQRNSKSIDAQPRLGYSSSIVHSIPGFKGADAESLVKFNFQPQKLSNRDNRYAKTTSNAPSSKIFTRTSLSGDSNNPNSFNVGYNLTFNDNNFNVRKTEPRHNYINNKKFENAEVITGRSKKNEKVRAPNIDIDLSAKDFVVSALLKKHQLNPGFTRTNTLRAQIPKYPGQFSTVTYETQQNIFKDVVKATKPEPIQRGPELEAVYKTSSRWSKFKPASENNLQRPNTFNINSERSFGPIQASSFNHEAALRNGQIFSFNDVHNGMSLENTNIADNFPAGSEVFDQKANIDDGVNGNVQQNSEINNINIEAHIPKNLRGIKPLPIDTSLLRDPVLTTSYKEVAQNPKVIPIHFDIRAIQDALQKEAGKPQSFGAFQSSFGSSSNVAAKAGSAHEDHSSAPSQTNFRIYGKPEPIDQDKYRLKSEYGKRHANYDEDIYKIASLRPPPVGQSIVY